MTTIAYDGLHLAVDDLRTYGSHAIPSIKMAKVQDQCGKYWITVGCGDVGSIQAISNWFFSSEKAIEKYPKVEEGNSLIIVNQEGKLYQLYED